MALALYQQVETNIPIDVAGITPDQLSGKSVAEVEKLPIWHGRRRVELAELFRVSVSSGAPDGIKFEGKLDAVDSIGAGMKSGSIWIESDAGCRVGCQMAGGEIIARGNVSDFLGVEMTAGTIRVGKNAGDSVGGSLPGSKTGMNRGSILVNGNVGKGLGRGMRRGTIVIGGHADKLVGWNMRAGTIVVFGQCGPNAGAEMVRGSIVMVGGSNHALLPTFTSGGKFPLPVMSMIAKWLRDQPFECQEELLESSFEMFHGDWLKGGRGEVFIR